ncbi:MAG: LytR/AlgR family response regulator transcription factor [Gemmatimonadota bacterium]
MNEANRLPIRALLVDDEPAARRGLRLLLAPRDDFEIAGECGTADEIGPALDRFSPDVVFLDVRMPGGTGIEALREACAGEGPLVVLVTAFEDHALEAFDIEAIDYLLKPFSDEAFERALERVRRHVDRIRAREATRRIADVLGPEALEQESPPGHFAIRYGDRIRLVSPDSIRWVAAEGDYVRIHTSEGEHLLRETMSNMQERLSEHPSGRPFVRIHRSTLVRADFVQEVRARGRGRYAAVLRDSTRRNISRSGQERLQRALGVDL